MTKRRQPLGQTIGGVLFGFEQQVFRNAPPPHELVHHARPDASVAAGDGTMLTIGMPGDDENRRTAMDDMQLREVSGQHTVAVRVQAPMAEVDIAALCGRYLALVGDHLGSAGIAPAGAPFVRYHRWGGDEADVEIGIPVSDIPVGMAPLADVKAGEPGVSSLPAGLAGVAMHVGPYTGLPATYDALHEWIHAQGHDEGKGPWESYVDDPGGADPATVRTEVIWPVA
jgi:effector-binding domain-containing protein